MCKVRSVPLEKSAVRLYKTYGVFCLLFVSVVPTFASPEISIWFQQTKQRSSTESTMAGLGDHRPEHEVGHGLVIVRMSLIRTGCCC